MCPAPILHIMEPGEVITVMHGRIIMTRVIIQLTKPILLK